MMPSCSSFIKSFFWLLFFVYAVVPLLLYFYPQILTRIVFFHIYHCPHYSKNFSDFPLYGLDPSASRNFALRHSAGHRLGVWQLEPEATKEESEFVSKLLDGRPVILYFHGNALNRGGHHMVSLYKRLLQENVHVLAIDYRGYGDSSGSPHNEEEIVSDANELVKFAIDTVGVPSVYFWGHSLGTGIASRLARDMAASGLASKLAGIVLESPFNNISDGVRNHAFAFAHSWTPYFESLFVDGVAKCGIFFDSDKNLESVEVPILIAHAADDRVVPLTLGQRLHQHLLQRGKRRVRLLELPAGKGYRHVHAWKAPELYEAFRDLITAGI